MICLLSWLRVSKEFGWLEVVSQAECSGADVHQLMISTNLNISSANLCRLKINSSRYLVAWEDTGLITWQWLLGPRTFVRGELY